MPLLCLAVHIAILKPWNTDILIVEKLMQFRNHDQHNSQALKLWNARLGGDTDLSQDVAKVNQPSFFALFIQSITWNEWD